MKMSNLWLLPVALLMVGCSQNNTFDSSESEDVVKADETSHLVCSDGFDTSNLLECSGEVSKAKEQVLYANNPKYDLDKNTIQLTGKVNPSFIITLKSNGELIKELPPSDSNKFSFTVPIPEVDDITYEISDGKATRSVIVKSKTSITMAETEKEAEIEIKRAEEERIIAEKEAEAKAKREEEDRKKAEKDAEEKEMADAAAAEKAEDDRIKKVEAEEQKKKDDIINNSSREQNNALKKAKEYLNYTAFSKVGLYEQLLYEQFPEEAALFAVDYIETDWDSQALNKAKDYLAYSSFSKEGLFDQLLHEEFTTDQAQYAINNIQVDWSAQALSKAIDYLNYSSFSDQGLYDQLLYEGFTSEQTQYAIDNLPQ